MVGRSVGDQGDDPRDVEGDDLRDVEGDDPRATGDAARPGGGVWYSLKQFLWSERQRAILQVVHTHLVR